MTPTPGPMERIRQASRRHHAMWGQAANVVRVRPMAALQLARELAGIATTPIDRRTTRERFSAILTGELILFGLDVRIAYGIKGARTVQAEGRYPGAPPHIAITFFRTEDEHG